MFTAALPAGQNCNSLFGENASTLFSEENPPAEPKIEPKTEPNQDEAPVNPSTRKLQTVYSIYPFSRHVQLSDGRICSRVFPRRWNMV